MLQALGSGAAPVARWEITVTTLRCCALFAFALLLGSASASAEDQRAGELARVVRSWHEAGRFDGAVLVADEGRIVWQGGAGHAVREWNNPNGPWVRYPIASLTKQFAAVLTLQLVEEGRLTLDGRIAELLPDFRKDTGERILIRHLLSHA